MKLSVVALNVLLAAGLAAPAAKSNARSRLSRRAHSRHEGLAAQEETEYNESWAGAALFGDDFSGVSATFAIPEPKIPTDGQTSATHYTASSWIGFDGINCNNLWQAGVDGTIDSSGAVSYYAWYEWYPADTQAIELGDLSAGDIINFNLTTSSTTQGTVVMENKSNGKSFSKTVTSSDALCGVSAEWIMEDLVVDGNQEGLANFGNVTFQNAAVTKSSGSVGPAAATLMDIQDGDNKLTKSSITSDTVVINYL